MTTRLSLLFATAAVLTVGAPSTVPGDDADATKKLAETLKGKWQLTSRIDDGVASDADFVKNRTMVVGDGKYTLYDGKEEFLTTTLKLDATKKPHHYDLPDLKQYGILKLEGDVLTISLGPADGARATEFASPKGKDWVLVTYKRVK